MSRPIDVAGLRDELDPVHLGHDAGQRGLPTPESSHDPHEHPIVEKIERLMRDERSSLEDQLEQADKHLKKLHGPEWRGDMNTAQQNAFTRLDDVGQIRSQDIHHRRVEADKRLEDLRKFRQDNRLHREPNYPDANWRIFSWGVVAILFLVESIANSVFLAKGNELGLVGAYGVAFGISLTNLLPPFFAFGPLSRNFVHTNFQRRLLAWISTSAYAAIAFTLNLGVAHYREVSGRLMGDAGVEVVRRMTQNPLGLQDAESWLLLVLGLIFSLIAFFDGYKLDDAYPGYGKLDRLRAKARDAHRDELDEVSGALEEIRDEALEAVKRTADKAREQPRERQRIAANQRRLIEEFRRYVDDLERAGAELIAEYREANRSARPDGRTPEAHRKPWSLERPEMSDPPDDVAPLSEKQLQQIEDDYQQATDRIHGHYKTARSRILNGGEANAPADVSLATESAKV